MKIPKAAIVRGQTAERGYFSSLRGENKKPQPTRSLSTGFAAPGRAQSAQQRPSVQPLPAFAKCPLPPRKKCLALPKRREEEKGPPDLPPPPPPPQRSYSCRPGRWTSAVPPPATAPFRESRSATFAKGEETASWGEPFQWEPRHASRLACPEEGAPPPRSPQLPCRLDSPSPSEVALKFSGSPSSPPLLPSDRRAERAWDSTAAQPPPPVSCQVQPPPCPLPREGQPPPPHGLPAAGLAHRLLCGAGTAGLTGCRAARTRKGRASPAGCSPALLPPPPAHFSGKAQCACSVPAGTSPPSPLLYLAAAPACPLTSRHSSAPGQARGGRRPITRIGSARESGQRAERRSGRCIPQRIGSTPGGRRLPARSYSRA